VFRIISHTEKAFIEKALKNKMLEENTDYVIMNVRPEEVPSAIAEADLSIMFFHKRLGSDAATSPVKFAESLAAGVPVIVNKGTGDVDEYVDSRRIGVTVTDFSQEGYARAIDGILELLRDRPGLRDRCRGTAKEYFSLDMGIKRYLDVYKGLEKEDHDKRG